MLDSLETLDRRSSNSSINRFSMLIKDDGGKLLQLIGAYGKSADASSSMNNLLAKPEMTPEEAEQAVLPFIKARMNITAVNESGVIKFIYGVGNEITYWAFLDTEYNTRYAAYYPRNETDTSLVGTTPWTKDIPIINASVYKNIVEDDPAGGHQILKLLVPNSGDDKPMIVAMVEIIDPTDTNETVLGHLVAGRALLPRMKQYSDDAPSCIVIQDGAGNNSVVWDDEDRKQFAKVVPGTFALNKDYGGVPTFLKRDNATIQKTKYRVCPNLPLFQPTASLMVGYFSLCGLDPNNPRFKDGASCVNMRVDRPMSMVERGSTPIITLQSTTSVMMVVLCIIFLVFLDYVVLRRIVNLSNVIKQQTKGHTDALKDEDETSATASLVGDEEHGGSKSGKHASGSSEGSSYSAGSTDAPAPKQKSARGEIDNLKRAMEQNAIGLRKRLETVNDSIKIEIQKNIRQKQAVQLLNLWCVRKDFYPGLRPNAVNYRYEPPRDIDDLLSNPLAVEYLKSHCESDRTLENLWFVLDVAWLKDLEAAEENEEDEERRSQIHDVVTYTAKTIMERYIVANAPQQINVSAGTFKKLREKNGHYSRNMFEDAVGEVKLMLNTDILPRFQKTASYCAMSETLFIDSAGGDDESSFSDDSVSTTGSILTEDGEGGGVSRLFTRTLKNLKAYEGGQDDNSSSISAGSSLIVSRGPIPSGPADATDNSSSKDSSSEPKEDDSPEGAKKESEQSDVSTDSSSSSDSSSVSVN